MRYVKMIIIAFVVSIVMEFLTRFLIKKVGKDKTLSIIKTIAVVGIAMFIKELI